ncbi:phage portal protein [Streptosporangium sp. CA-115845]|uniref:phage portal protein n=1 Tax=Streptosporangium sp. CA-115845 TaxID=3240071 RepID=UPI003D89BBCC
MALSEKDVVDTSRRLLKMREQEQPRLRKISAYMRGEASSVYVPRGARQEYRWLIKRAKVNILPLVITVVAQALYVDGYRPNGKDVNADAWDSWQANRMDARQHGLHRASLKYGVSYNVVMPGKPTPVITPKSPKRMTAFYEDPVDDEWPEFAVEETIRNGLKGQTRSVRLYDDTHRYILKEDIKPGGKLLFVRSEEHGLKVCPVVRYLNGDDLDGEDCIRGEVEPLFEMQDQLNSTTFNLLMAQQYAAFRQRWVTGMAPPIDSEGNPMEPFNASVSRLWVAEDEGTKFGEFGQTDLSGYLKSAEETIRHIATVSQTPPHHLLGQMSNLSAEALAAAESGLQRKIAERKSGFGESHEQTLRLASLAAGDKRGWSDMSAQVVWRDTEARALASTVDALGKLKQMLDVPAQELWERIPGVTQTDVARWKAAAERGDAEAQLNAIVDKQKAAANAMEDAPPPPPVGVNVGG